VGGAIEDGIGDGADGAADAVETATQRILTALGALRSDLGAAAAAAAGAIFDPILKQAELAQTQLDIAEQTRIIKDKKSTAAQVAEARLRRTELQKQLFLQISDLTTYGTDAERIAAIKAALASDAVATAYRDGTPEQKAAIDEWRRVMGVQLTKLEGQAQTGGEDYGDAYGDGLADSKGAVTAGAKTAASGVDTALKLKQAHQWGVNTGAGYASGLGSMGPVIKRAAYLAVRGAVGVLRALSPPGPASPLHHIGDWGQNTIQEWIDGILAKARDVRRAAATVSAAAAPSLSMPSLGSAVRVPGSTSPAAFGASAVAAPAGGGTTINNITANLNGLPRTLDPLGATRELSRLASFGELTPKPRFAP
jgi:hypothetical protein